MTDPRERWDHVAWCKARALQYLDAGDLNGALTSMGSDMAKREDCRINPHFYAAGMMAVAAGDAAAVRRWVEGFN